MSANSANRNNITNFVVSSTCFNSLKCTYKKMDKATISLNIQKSTIDEYQENCLIFDQLILFAQNGAYAIDLQLSRRAQKAQLLVKTNGPSAFRLSSCLKRVNTLPALAVVSQFYVTEAENEYVIRANSAIMKCKIPSFVSEFIHVDQWVADDGTIYMPGQEYGMRPVDVERCPRDNFCVLFFLSRSFSFPYHERVFSLSSRLLADNCRLQLAARYTRYSNFYFRIHCNPP